MLELLPIVIQALDLSRTLNRSSAPQISALQTIERLQPITSGALAKSINTIRHLKRGGVRVPPTVLYRDYSDPATLDFHQRREYLDVGLSTQVVDSFISIDLVSTGDAVEVLEATDKEFAVGLTQISRPSVTSGDPIR